MIALDDPKAEYHREYNKTHKEQINENARIRRRRQKEHADKYVKLVPMLRSIGIDAEKLLRGGM